MDNSVPILLNPMCLFHFLIFLLGDPAWAYWGEEKYYKSSSDLSTQDAYLKFPLSMYGLYFPNF
jgi:hypothetical protein